MKKVNSAQFIAVLIVGISIILSISLIQFYNASAATASSGAIAANPSVYGHSIDEISGIDKLLKQYAASQNSLSSIIEVNGNIGIGTTTPTAKLDVAGVIKGTAVNAETLNAGEICLGNECRRGWPSGGTSSSGSSSGSSDIILASKTVEKTAPTTETNVELLETLTLSQPGILIVTGDTRTGYTGSQTQSAWTDIVLSVDNAECKRGIYPEYSQYATYATCIKELAAGTHTIKAAHQSTATKYLPEKIRIEYSVIAKQAAGGSVGTEQAITTVKTASIDYTQCNDYTTLTDSNGWTICQDGYVMVGLVGGYGHSSAYNSPHTIRCCKLI